MKLKLLYALPLLTLLAGCMGSNNKNAAPVPVPSGNFKGQFRAIHQNSKTGYHDTLKAILNLSLSTTTGFKVTGDTATVHAGSFGDYAMNSALVQFVDNTLPTTGKPAKIHLSGYYQYYYDGTVFQMLAAPSDTLVYQYDLKKVN
jgi:hypothetical protein